MTMTQLALFQSPNSAVLSPCRRYRYALRRVWGAGDLVVFCMLNPSTADAETDDATIRKITRFAKSWGFGGLLVGNLYGWRSTDPAALEEAPDPVGPENDAHLVKLADEAALIICAWGVNAEPERAAFVTRLLRASGKALHCLGRNENGTPCHPLFKPGHLKPILMEEALG